MTPEDVAEQKRVAFDNLYALDELSAEEDDPGLAGSVQAIKGKVVGDSAVHGSLANRTRRRTPAISRSLSTPYPPTNHQFLPSTRTELTALQLLEHVEIVKETPVPSLRKSATVTGVESSEDPTRLPFPPLFPQPMPLSSLKKSLEGASAAEIPTMPSSSALPSFSAIPKAIGRKRKREGALAEIRLVPEDQRVFSGLNFCMQMDTVGIIVHNTDCIQTSSPTATATKAAT